jgi:hypothetical protein
MKKLILLALLAGTCYLSSFSQTTYDNYKDQIIYVKKSSVNIEPYASRVSGFFKTPTETEDTSNIVYPIIEENGESHWSKRDSLLNKKFICIGVIDKKTQVFLKLQNEKTGIIYFTSSYMPDNIATEDELKKDKINADKLVKEQIARIAESNKNMSEYLAQLKNPCLQIDENYDDFSRTKNYETGYFKPENPNNSETLNPTHEPPYDIMYHKEKSKNGISYFISLTANSITALARERGVIIILKNKKRINKPNAIVETEVNEHGDDYDRFIRKSYIKLNDQDIQLLKQSPIDEFELYDEQVKELDYNNLYAMFLCLLNK